MKGLRIRFLTIYPKSQFCLCNFNKNSFKDSVSKLGIKNPKTIFLTIFIFQYLTWTYVVSHIFGINDKNISSNINFIIFIQNINSDLGGYWWPLAYSTWIPNTASFQFRCFQHKFLFLAVFQVINFLSYFEALNDVFFGKMH